MGACLKARPITIKVMQRVEERTGTPKGGLGNLSMARGQ